MARRGDAQVVYDALPRRSRRPWQSEERFLGEDGDAPVAAARIPANNKNLRINSNDLFGTILSKGGRSGWALACDL